MTKKQKRRERTEREHIKNMIDFANAMPRRFMDSEGKHEVPRLDPRYETAPFEEIIIQA